MDSVKNELCYKIKVVAVPRMVVLRLPEAAVWTLNDAVYPSRKTASGCHERFCSHRYLVC